MSEQVLEVYNKITEFLQNNIDHGNKKIDYILYDENKNDFYTLASDSIEDAIEFTPYTDGIFQYVPEWDYNFDNYIYNYLEKGFKIGYMSDEVHYGLWNSINELYPNDIEYKQGVEYYIDYCKKNGITKEYLDKVMELDTPDIFILTNKEMII